MKTNITVSRLWNLNQIEATLAVWLLSVNLLYFQAWFAKIDVNVNNICMYALHNINNYGFIFNINLTL